MVDSDLDLLSAAATTQKMNAQKRKLKQKREPNWTLVEKETLRNICLEYMEVINNRRTDNEMCGLKNRTWVKITEAMRKSGYHRNVSRVREAYARMKKVDKGVVVLQLSTGKRKEADLGNSGGGDRRLLSRKGYTLPCEMQRNTHSAHKYCSDDSESDDSNESPLAKRLSLSLRRKSNDSLCAERENSTVLRHSLGELQLKRAHENGSKGNQEEEQVLKHQEQGKKAEGHFELENLNLKAEIGSSLDYDNSASTSYATPTKDNNAYAEPDQCSNSEMQCIPKRIRRTAGTNCINNNNLPLMSVQIEEAQMSNEPETLGSAREAEDTLCTTEVDADMQRKAEMHRYQMSAEEKRLALLDLQLDQVRLQMRYERHLYEKDLEAKQCKLELMRHYKK